MPIFTRDYKSQINFDRPDPKKVKLGELSANKLASLSGLASGKLAKKSIAELSERYPFQIDPQFLFMRRVCGKVVKIDPVTGIEYPVPFATVEVQDTDCSLIAYFPKNSPWTWFYPFHCRRETIATVKTDECGNFCVWIPRFEIDWVLRWRKLRLCFPVIFQRPTLDDLIDPFPLDKLPPIDLPRPLPDPLPLPRPLPRVLTRNILRSPELARRISERMAVPTVARLEASSARVGFGSPSEGARIQRVPLAELGHLTPPLPPELKEELAEGGGRDGELQPGVATIAHRLQIDPKELRALDLRRYIGPFRRCRDIFLPDWQAILDVPDVTFRVLQDTDGDGTEEQIYGETHFDVRWDLSDLDDIVLEAGPNAIAGPVCGPVGGVPCGNEPAIVMANRLPLTGDPSVFDPATGYAKRTNRPHPSGDIANPLPMVPASSPLRHVLSLYGCNATEPGATHYRVTYAYSADGGANFTTPTPFINLSWTLYRLNGAGLGEYHSVVSDSKGWYPIALPAGPNNWLPQDLLLDWPTQARADGVYRLTLELGAAGTDVATSSSDQVSIVVENTRPVAPITVEYSLTPGGPFTPIDGVCPVIRRGTTPQPVYFRVTMDASAGHLRSARLVGDGCGGGEFVFTAGSGGINAGGVGGPVDYGHWHVNALDNSQTLQVFCTLPASRPEGTYNFHGHAASRAFYPGNGDHLATPPWETSPYELYIQPTMLFSVFNSNP